MRTIPLTFAVITVFSTGALTSSARAQSGGAPSDTHVPPVMGSPVVSGSFVMPEDRDPERLTFTMEGFLYTQADSSITAPGDDDGTPLSGSVLLGGLNLFGKITPIQNPVVEVDIFTNYTGPLAFDSLVGMDPSNPPGPFPFNPWHAQRLQILPTGFTQGFRFYKDSPRQADLNMTTNATGFQALVMAALQDTSIDTTGFKSSSFGFQGFTSVQDVPEPGILALLTGFSISGGLLWRRKQRQLRP